MSFTIIILEREGSDRKPDLCIDIIPKQLYYEFDPTTDKKKFRATLKFHIQLYSF